MPTFHHIALIYNVTGQVIEWYPPQSEVVRDGAPVAATYRVFGGTQGMDQTPKIATATASLDTVSTTVIAESGYSRDDRTLLYVSLGTGIVVGRRYLLSNALGQREVVVPASVSAAGTIILEEPLAYTYVISDTLVGLRQSFVIPSSFIQDAQNINVWSGWRGYSGRTLLTDIGGTSTQAPPFQVEWNYVLSSLALRSATSFDVERRKAKADLSMQDLRELVPDAGFFEWANQRGQDFAPQLVAAERDVAIDTRLAGYNPDQIVDPQIWNRIVLQKWLVVIGKGLLFTQDTQPIWLSTAIEDYDKLFQGAVGATCRAWVDTGASGAITPDPARQLWLRGR